MNANYLLKILHQLQVVCCFTCKRSKQTELIVLLMLLVPINELLAQSLDTTSTASAIDIAWRTRAPMPTARDGLNLAQASNGKLYAIGGNSAAKNCSKTVEEYDPVSNTWTAKTPILTGRAGAAAAVQNGRIYIIGGQGPTPDNWLNSVEEYNPTTDTWATRTSMPTARSAPGAAVTKDGKIYVIGGSPGGCYPLSTVEAYDPMTDTWTTKASMPTARWALGVTALNGKIYAVGGQTACNSPHSLSAATEEYDPATNTWKTLASLPTAREFPLLVASHGFIFALGGDNGSVSFNTVNAYDPLANRWKAATPSTMARYAMGVTATNDGRIYAIGGNATPNVVSYLSTNEEGTILASLYHLLSLGDTNQDTTPELAVITHDATRLKTVATIKDAKTGGLVKTIAFNGRYVPVKANVVNDLNGNGAPEIAVLGVNNSNQSVQAEVRDSLTSIKLSTVPFTSNGQTLDIALIRNFSGAGSAALAVLQQADTDPVVELANAKTGQFIRSIVFSSEYNGIDLIAINDLNGNKTKELAVLLDNTKPGGGDSVEIRDSSDGQLLHLIAYGSGSVPKQLLSIADVNNNGSQELAILRTNSSSIAVKDAQTGQAVNTLNYKLKQPYKLVSVADDVSAVTDIAMLGQSASGQISADVRSVLTDSLIDKIAFDTYGTTVGFISIPDINGNGVAELVRLREQPGPQKLFAEVRDGRTGEWLQGMYF